MMMLVLYGAIAIFIAGIWIEYFRLIDIFEPEKLTHIIIQFILGGLSVLLVFGFSRVFNKFFYWDINGNVINDFLYCFLKIGLVEETAKLIPFLIFMIFFKSQINEPVDYVIFICVSALAFAAVENFLYFKNAGAQLIVTRSILSTVGHIFDTALIAYGIILYKYKSEKNGFIWVVLFFLLAAFSHGFYDFWLLFEGAQKWGWFVTVMYFLLTISWFAIIMNNALNNSSMFSYKRMINTELVALKIIMYYGLVFIVQFIIQFITGGFKFAISNLTVSICFTGLIIFVTVIRLSRLKLIKNRWNAFTLELPFTFVQNDLYGNNLTRFVIRVKGESSGDVYVNEFFERYFTLRPISSRRTYIEYPRLAYMENKIFLKDDETFFVVNVFEDKLDSKFEKILLKPMINGDNMFKKKYPIVAVLKIDHIEDLEDKNLTHNDFEFMEWAYATPEGVD